MEINRRLHVEEGAIASGGLLPIRAVEGPFEVAEEILEILPLRGTLWQQNSVFLGFDIYQAPISVPGQSAFAGTKPVKLQQVTSGDLGRLQILGTESIDVHTVFPDL